LEKIIKVAASDPEFLSKFDSLVRTVRDSAGKPDFPVDVLYKKTDEISVLTITVHNLAGEQAKAEREAKLQKEADAKKSAVAAREARLKAKREAEKKPPVEKPPVEKPKSEKPKDDKTKKPAAKSAEKTLDFAKDSSEKN